MEKNKQIQVLKQTELCGRQFTVYGTAEQPLFLATEIAGVLDLSNVTDMVSRVDPDERSKFNLGRQGDAWFLTEDGLYEILMQSRKPVAKDFKRGVKTILKEIRRTGGYIAAKEDETPAEIMARALQLADVTIKRQQQRVQMLEGRVEVQQEHIRLLEPKAEYTDEVLQSPNTYTFTQMAKELDFRGVSNLTDFLKKKGIIFRQSGRWMTTADYSGRGYTKTRTVSFDHSDGRPDTTVYTVWTEPGRQFLHRICHSHREEATR
ncbi:hypothetical protein BHU11_10540 [Tannerella sp. oral taxon 808]|nr:hypothetical protein BHU11_10540 [Tannerella sp. oral taxon 808]